MVHQIPVLEEEVQTRPASKQVASTDDYVYGWSITLPAGQTPLSAVMTVLDYHRAIDVSTVVKSGGATTTPTTGTTCTVVQRLRNWTAGQLYLATIAVTTTSGQVFSYMTFFDCVG